jgi:hypothetical protein
MRTKTAGRTISIRDRLEIGNLTIDEVCELKPRSRSGFYADLKAGLVEIRKQGWNSIVPGPVARRYINDCARASNLHPEDARQIKIPAE